MDVTRRHAFAAGVSLTAATVIFGPGKAWLPPSPNRR